MVPKPIIERQIEKTSFWLLMATLVSLAFSIRFVASLSAILLVLLVSIHPRRKEMVLRAIKDPVFIFAFLLFLLQVTGLLYAGDSKQAWKELTKKAGLFAIPFFFCSWRMISQLQLRKLVTGFSLSLGFASLYCIISAAFLYSADQNPAHFFYHQLVSPFNHHAIFFSFFLFYCVLFWMETGIRETESSRRWIPVLTVIFFIGVMLLLSSKIAIGMLFLYILLYIVKSAVTKGNKWLLPVSLLLAAALAGILLLTENPVKKRFSDLAEGNSGLFRQEKFSPDIYFNGLQFRLLAWRFSYEILEEKNAWIAGVSPGDAQNELDQKYYNSNIYLGEDRKSGFLGFNCHNLYFQTLLESGITGLVFLLCFIFFFISAALKRKKYLALFFFIAMIGFGCTESLLSTQYAILLFLFLPLLAWKTESVAD